MVPVTLLVKPWPPHCGSSGTQTRGIWTSETICRSGGWWSETPTEPARKHSSPWDPFVAMATVSFNTIGCTLWWQGCTLSLKNLFVPISIAGNIWNTIAFTKPTYITFPTFRPGSSADISFHFKTYRDHGVFLENSDDQLRNFIRIELNSESIFQLSAKKNLCYGTFNLIIFSLCLISSFSNPQSSVYIHGW